MYFSLRMMYDRYIYLFFIMPMHLYSYSHVMGNIWHPSRLRLLYHWNYQLAVYRLEPNVAARSTTAQAKR